MLICKTYFVFVGVKLQMPQKRIHFVCLFFAFVWKWKVVTIIFFAIGYGFYACIFVWPHQKGVKIAAALMLPRVSVIMQASIASATLWA